LGKNLLANDSFNISRYTNQNSRALPGFESLVPIYDKYDMI